MNDLFCIFCYTFGHVGGCYMNAEEAVRFMQHYRHDLMNHLQIIHGYASMGNVKKIEEKIVDIIHCYNMERKLMHLQANEFCLWVMKHAYMYVDVKLEYDIHTEGKRIESIDQILTEQCEQFFAVIKRLKLKDEFITVHLVVKQEQKDRIAMHFSVSEFFNHAQLKEQLHQLETHFPLTVMDNSDTVECSFSVPCN